MKLARYIGNGEVAIVDEPQPTCPEGGLLVKTEASGLCSGELMSWYMDQKIPHVLGHEVAGIVVESQDERFPVGTRIFAHHHAPCGTCEMCRTGRYVHCETWRKTKLVPGGMAEFFGVPAANLTDTFEVGNLDAKEAALIEPLACVVKSVKLAIRAGFGTEGPEDRMRAAVIGLGVMGLMHMHYLREQEVPTVGYDLSENRLAWAKDHHLEVAHPESAQRANTVFVCPGSQGAFDLAMQIVEPGGTIMMFAPLGPGAMLQVPQAAYFKDIRILNSYSCGSTSTRLAYEFLASGHLLAEQVVSDFVSIEDLPDRYKRMKAGEILKAMVLFS